MSYFAAGMRKCTLLCCFHCAVCLKRLGREEELEQELELREQELEQERELREVLERGQERPIIEAIFRDRRNRGRDCTIL